MLADGAELTLKGTCTSVSWNDTKDEQQAEAGAALTVIREDSAEEGENADHAEEPGETTDPGEGSSDVPEGTEVSDPAKGEDPSGEDAGNVRSGERTITIEETISMPDRNVYWIDNNDEEGKRLAVTDFVPKLCYQYVDETGNAIPGQEPVELTEDNMEALGLTELPAVTVTDTGSGQYTVSVAGNLPTQITCTDAYGDTLAGYPKYIAWSLEAPETGDYSFREITEENKNDYPSAGGQMPASVTIGLYRTEKADGTDMSPVAGADGKQLTLELSETNGGWKGTFENLLKYNPDTGARYYYGIAELSVNGGSGTSMGDYIVHYNGSEETGFVVTNITPISITGTKTWVDHSNAYGTRPEDLTLTLYRQTAGGQEETVDIQPQWTKDGDNGDQWTYTYSDLPLTDDAANVYTYRVEETQAAPEGEAGKAGDTYEMTQEGYDFTNTLTGTTEVAGVKTWRDNGKTERGSIELTLYRNDEEYKTLTLAGEGDAWDYAFEDLPKYDEKGALYVYEVRETDAPEGYDVYYTEEGITNVQQGGLRLTKTVTGTGGDREKAFSFTVKLDDPAISGAHGDLLFQNGEATVNLSDGESAEADGYTVKSEGAAGEILPGEISEVRFENHKDAPVSAAGDSARTGDDSPVMLYLASALLALLLAAFALLLRRRLKR